MNLGAPKTPLVNYSLNGFGHFLLKFVKCSQSGGKKVLHRQIMGQKRWFDNNCWFFTKNSHSSAQVLHRFCTGKKAFTTLRFNTSETLVLSSFFYFVKKEKEIRCADVQNYRVKVDYGKRLIKKYFWGKVLHICTL